MLPAGSPLNSSQSPFISANPICIDYNVLFIIPDEDNKAAMLVRMFLCTLFLCSLTFVWKAYLSHLSKNKKHAGCNMTLIILVTMKQWKALCVHCMSIIQKLQIHYLSVCTLYVDHPETSHPLFISYICSLD